MTAPDVLVAVPARDEADGIGGCLAAVVRAGRHALDAGAVDRFRVAVAAHRCTDATAAAATEVLAAAGVDHLVQIQAEPMPVGVVRSTLVGRALRAAPPLDSARTWVFSTDADSVVPPDWVTSILATVERTGADLVAGLTALVGWDADQAAQDAYRRLLAAGTTSAGHRHVYAANLAVSHRAFTRAGGFPGSVHGEEHALVAAVRRTGGRVVSVFHPVVATSARMPGRAEHGLGALLQRLADPGAGSVEPAGAA